MPANILKKCTQNVLRTEDIDKIITTYENRLPDKYSHLAQLSELETNDYNLNIPRYVASLKKKML
jgi:type I restriction enzyme M protein